jgi:hypothetical protein
MRVAIILGVIDVTNACNYYYYSGGSNCAQELQ